MANINDLWKELQAAAAPAKGRLKGLSYTHRADTPGGGAKKKKGPGFIEQLQPKAAAAPPADSDIMVSCLLVLWVNNTLLKVKLLMGHSKRATRLPHLQAALQRDINCLSDGDRRLRIKAVSSQVFYNTVCNLPQHIVA